MTTSNVFIKDPDATLDYGFDWSQWLQIGESLYSFVVSATTGITVASSASTTGSVIVWLSGGTSGSRYDIACKITTTDNRIDERTIRIDVRNR